MKKLFIVLTLLFITVMLFGCGDTDNNTTITSTTPIQRVDSTGTLQGKIMDAITGAPLSFSVSGDQVLLIQGTINRGPDKLNTDPNDPLVGEYAFGGIPVQTASANTSFKVVAIKSGYQRFEANVTVNATDINIQNGFIDNVINMIGNIYLFPLGAVPADVLVNVRSPHGVPVPNVTVLLQQNVTNNSAAAITGNRLVASAGLNTSMTATTDANGQALFSGTNLVLGGSYIAVAEALNFQGDELQTTSTANAFIIGTDSTTQVINMGAVATFFATSASNQVPGTITPNGVLTVTFNEPITLSTTNFNAALVSTTSGTVTSPVVAVLSNNNQTITLTPTFTANPLGAGASISYSYPLGETIVLQNSQTVAQCGVPLAPCTLFTGGANDVRNRTTGAPVSGTVQMIAN